MTTHRVCYSESRRYSGGGWYWVSVSTLSADLPLDWWSTDFLTVEFHHTIPRRELFDDADDERCGQYGQLARNLPAGKELYSFDEEG